MHWQNIGELLHREMASGIVMTSLARLVLADSGRAHRTGTRTAPPAGGTAHESVHLLWRGHVHLALERIGGRALRLYAHCGADYSRHWIYRCGVDSAHARADHRTDDGGDFVCGGIGGNGHWWRALPDRDFCHGNGFDCAVCTGPSGTNLQPEDAADEL